MEKKKWTPPKMSLVMVTEKDVISTSPATVVDIDWKGLFGTDFQDQV